MSAAAGVNDEPGARPPFWEKSAFALALVTLIGSLAYYNSFQVPFLLDDYRSIVRNRVIQDLGTFLSGAGYHYNPRRFIGYLTLALNFRLGGLDVTGYHLFNLAVHLICGWLVYALGVVTFRTPFFATVERGVEGCRKVTPAMVALFAALLFVAHPVQTQAVTYVIQRVASLCTLFYLLSLVLYAKARISPASAATWKGRALTAALYLMSLASALLAMTTKEIAFTLPLAVVLYEVLFFRMGPVKRLLLLSPVLLTALVVPITLLGAGRPLAEVAADLAQRTRVDSTLPRLHYLYTQFRVLVTYLRLLLFPGGQNLDYDYPVYTSLSAPPVFLSLLLLSGLAVLALHLIQRTSPGAFADGGSGRLGPELRLVSFGILWFFLTLSVESSLIPIADVIFEHRLYLATPGVFIAVAAAVFSFSEKLALKWLVTAAGAAVAVLVLFTVARNSVWSDPVRLARDVVAKSPGKARPHYNLAEVLSKAGWAEEALREAELAARLDPRRAEPRTLMGTLYLASGRYDSAIQELRRAVASEPNYAPARTLLGDALARKGMHGEALAQYQSALQLNPGNPEIYNRIGVSHLATGQAGQATAFFASALRLSPNSVAYRNNLARARVRSAGPSAR